MKINGNTYSNIVYYGGTPIVGNAYRVFVPFGNMSQAFTLIFADTSPGESGVQSVNGKTGDVVLTAVDVGALPSGTKIPNKTSDLINDSGYITESAVPTKTSELINDSGYVDITAAKNAAPVQSVNSKTGTVVIGKTDVGLGNVDNVKQYSISNPPPYPVTSVNGQTGDVMIEVDGIVEEGTSGMWTYRKYASGRLECFGTKTYTGNASSPWGSMYVLSCTAEDYPVAFVYYPNIQREPVLNNEAGCWIASYGTGSKTNCGTFALVRPTSMAVNVSVKFFATGHWK